VASFAHDAQAAARHARVLDERTHRPWPVPDAPWIMGQTWERLLFAHWRVDPLVLRPVVHPAIPIDTFDGSAWIGVTPFTVTGFHLRRMPPLPLTSSFHEVNVRTYATIDGRPGIYFLSLDAASRVAVEGARRLYRLPYFLADIDVEDDGDRVRYSHERTHDDGPPAAFEAEYEPLGAPFTAKPGTLDHWLTERYCLYTLDERQRVLRADIHHPPWSLREARATIARNTLTRPFGVEASGDPVLHHAARQDVLFWPLAPLDGSAHG
jgi:uncharacterized protein YqjF (DUF2071 family)